MITYNISTLEKKKKEKKKKKKKKKKKIKKCYSILEKKKKKEEKKTAKIFLLASNSAFTRIPPLFSSISRPPSIAKSIFGSIPTATTA